MSKGWNPSIPAGRLDLAGGSLEGLGRPGFGGFTFSLSKTALKGGGAGPTGQEDAANNKPPHPGLFTPQKSKKAFLKGGGDRGGRLRT